ncbi:MAG: anthranilate phosphoribosyltransferase, partial [Desulfobulbaceae bacterium]|nr:anthranilate phosphoribosyltransferase [Desulfobulbaceae bacterium]
EAIQKFGGQIQRLIRGEDLTRQETYEMFREVMRNEQPDLQQGAFLGALVAKGETVDEIAGAWEAIDQFDTVHVESEIPGPIVENSGTGMDKLNTFNVSSAAAIVAASCGATMARHGARALSSFCGTVDIIEAMGVNVECDVETVAKSIRECGIGLFNGMSGHVHPGALGRILSQIRFGSTLNIAASLANPCKPTIGLRGVGNEKLLLPSAQVMARIGYQRGMVVHGYDKVSGDGMDEISLCGETRVVEFTGETCREYTLTPEDAGLTRVSVQEIATTNDLQSETERFKKVLVGDGPAACIDFTCLNAGAILYLAGISDSIKDGVAQSKAAIASGASAAKLQQWQQVQN